MRTSIQASDVVQRFRARGNDPPGFTLYAYAAVQVWAQAVRAAGSLDLDAVLEAMHSRQFGPWAGSALMPRATSPDSSRGDRTSGRKTVPTCYESQAPDHAHPAFRPSPPSRDQGNIRFPARTAGDRLSATRSEQVSGGSGKSAWGQIRKNAPSIAMTVVGRRPEVGRRRTAPSTKPASAAGSSSESPASL
jgi:hypothetical protein